MAPVTSLVIHPVFWALLFLAFRGADMALHLWLLRLGRKGKLGAMFDTLDTRGTRILNLALVLPSKLCIVAFVAMLAAIVWRFI